MQVLSGAFRRGDPPGHRGESGMASGQSATRSPDPPALPSEIALPAGWRCRGCRRHTWTVSPGYRGHRKHGRGIQDHGAEPRNNRRDEVRCAVGVEDGPGELRIERAAVSIRHDGLEQREWPVNQRRGFSGVDECRQKDEVGDIRQLRDSLADDSPTVRVGDHDHPLAICCDCGASRFDVISESREGKLDCDRFDLAVVQFGQHFVPTPRSVPRTMNQDKSCHVFGYVLSRTIEISLESSEVSLEIPYPGIWRLSLRIEWSRGHEVGLNEILGRAHFDL